MEILLFTPALLSFLFPLELSQVTDVCNDVELMDGKPKDECEKEELKNKMSEDVSEKPKVEQVKDEVEENDDQGVETDDEDVESDDECVMETTPEMEDASVVKYSVKTTPFLQRWVHQMINAVQFFFFINFFKCSFIIKLFLY